MAGARYAVGRVLIDAIQWTGSNSDEVKAWSGLDAPDGRCAFVLPGEMAGVNGFPRWWSPAVCCWRVVHVNDWLVRATTDWGPIEGVYTDAYFREVFTPVPVVADQPPPPDAEAESLRAELTAARAKLRRLAADIRYQQEAAERKNRELDALHLVWCSGGCPSGVHRWSDLIVTEELVATAERNTRRLRAWYESVRLRLGTADEWLKAYAARAAVKTDLGGER